MVEKQKHLSSDQIFNKKQKQPGETGGTIVYCQFYTCVHNTVLENENKKSLTDFKMGYAPIFPKEAELNGFCNREVIALKSPGNVPTKFPNCFQYSNKKDEHSLHWANSLDAQGNALGGIIESQNPDHGPQGYV